MNKLSISSPGKPVKQLSGELVRKANDVVQGKVIRGKLDEPKEVVLPLIEPAAKGLLEISIDGRKYKMTDLTADGEFHVVPDFK